MEMTGLDAETDRILEVATIVTDFAFKELEVYEMVVNQPDSALDNMDEWNQIHHAKSGLLAKVARGRTEAEAEEDLLELVRRHFDTPAILAGNSVHFDRQFIKIYWPQLESALHYRMLDVSAWKVLMQSKFNHEFKKQEKHRALEDIRESIAELKDYLKYFDRA